MLRSASYHHSRAMDEKVGYPITVTNKTTGMYRDVVPYAMKTADKRFPLAVTATSETIDIQHALVTDLGQFF
jgi:hypothetical protein